MMYRLTVVALALGCSLNAGAQSSVKDSAIAMSVISVEFAGHIPGADLADRFGANFGAGAGYAYKFSSNWLIGLHGTYLFGSIVNHPRELLKPLRTSRGAILSASGNYANILFQERGLHIEFYTEKIFPVIGPNDNSGLFARVGVGFLEHKIRFEAREDDVPQVEGKLGGNYDRLSAGFSLSQMVGYRNMSNNKLVNFFIGIEAVEGFTNPQRPYNIDLMEPEENNRLDALLGIRAGWTLLLYGQEPHKFYYH